MESRFLAITLAVWRQIDTSEAPLGAALGVDGRRDAVKQIVAEVFSWLVRPLRSRGARSSAARQFHCPEWTSGSRNQLAIQGALQEDLLQVAAAV